MLCPISVPAGTQGQLCSDRGSDSFQKSWVNQSCDVSQWEPNPLGPAPALSPCLDLHGPYACEHHPSWDWPQTQPISSLWTCLVIWTHGWIWSLPLNWLCCASWGAVWLGSAGRPPPSAHPPLHSCLLLLLPDTQDRVKRQLCSF